jgi:hypothetical protein
MRVLREPLAGGADPYLLEQLDGARAPPGGSSPCAGDAPR